MKKFYSCGILLILLLTAALTIFAGCDSYEYERADGFKIYYCEKKKTAVLAKYEWDGDLSHLDVNIPDAYKGCAVTALSGYVSPTGPDYAVQRLR